MQTEITFRRFLYKNSYLLVIAAWLITISFIIDNYWSGNSSVKAVQANLQQYVQREEKDFDKLVAAAMRFADEDGETLVIVTADHETGGLSLLDGDISKGYADANFSTNDHSAVMVPVFAYGPHSLEFRGVYENTEIFEKIVRLLKR